MGGMKKTSREKAQAHARHAYFCSCSIVVRGNGARAQHRARHERANDGHRYVSREVWESACARSRIDGGASSASTSSVMSVAGDNVGMARERTRQLAIVAQAGGTIVGGSDPCVCGHAPEDHGRDPAYPGSTSCRECGDDCIAYESNPDE